MMCSLHHTLQSKAHGTQIKTELLGTAVQLALPNAIQKLALLFILEEP